MLKVLYFIIMWRNVSFADHIELHFGGNVLPQSMKFGDVDNDGVNELVVGNIDGDLCIFKGYRLNPVQRASNLGMITSLSIGDIFNTGKNYLVCLSAEGRCHVFDVKAISIKNDMKEDDRRGSGGGRDTPILYPIYQQRLPANSRDMLLCDAGKGGIVAMVVTYSDRQVRMFCYQSFSEVQVSSTGVPCHGQIVQVEKWQLAGQTALSCALPVTCWQIGSVTTDRTRDGRTELLVSQPGRTYATLIQHSSLTDSDSDSDDRPSFVFHPLGHSRVRNKEGSTIITSGIRRKDSDSTYSALASLDGTLVLVEQDKILWSMHVDHQLFVLDKLDLTGNGQEDVVCCSWDGQTYIVNHGRQVVRFNFMENVAAFATGHYGLPDAGNVPCFVYATFRNQLFIYHSIDIPNVNSSYLLSVLRDHPTNVAVFKALGISATDTNKSRELYHFLLYGNM